MLLDTRAINYLAAVAQAVAAGRLPMDAMTETCPECTQVLDDLDNDHHIVMPRAEGGDAVFVVVGCEGYWVIDPNSVGIPSDTWQDWRPEAYVGRVAAAVAAAGYTALERFVEGAEALDAPEHVIRVDLGGPSADLVWDAERGWTLIVYPFPGSTAADDLSRRLTDQTDANPREVARLARILLDEAADRWTSAAPNQNAGTR